MAEWRAFIKDDKDGNVVIYLQNGTDLSTREVHDLVEHDVKAAIPKQAAAYLAEANAVAKKRNAGEKE